MARRPDTQESVLLALELLKRIPRNRMISAPELLEQMTSAGFARDLRTIQRQLEMLSEHFDIERDTRNKPYGYRWKERSAGLSIPALGTQESLLLRIAEQQLKSLLPATLMKSMAGFFEQAKRNLQPTDNTKKEHSWLSKVRVISESQPLLPPKVLPEIFEQVSEALLRDVWLEIVYVNANKEKHSRKVMPLGLIQQGPRLYLVCRFDGYEDTRSLALHRMLTAKAMSLPFQRPKDFDLRRFETEGGLTWGTGRQIQLVIRIDKEAGLHITESPLSQDQVVEELADHYVITATVADTLQLDWWLRGFGDKIEILTREPVQATIETEKKT